jgi:mRNA-degrading endonuclease YafQ of YafQ-DinJ toxin-antitoxin module
MYMLFIFLFCRDYIDIFTWHTIKKKWKVEPDIHIVSDFIFIYNYNSRILNEYLRIKNI